MTLQNNSRKSRSNTTTPHTRNTNTALLQPLDIGSQLRFGDLCFSPNGDRLFWFEGRSGTGVVCSYHFISKQFRDHISGVRAKVGYGGGEFTVGTSALYYVAAENGQLYRLPLTTPDNNQQVGYLDRGAQRLTPIKAENNNSRTACPTLFAGESWLAYIEQQGEIERILAVPMQSFTPQEEQPSVKNATASQTRPVVLAHGADFYMQPRISADGKWLAYIEWNHPFMQWDNSRLRLAPLTYCSGVLCVGEAFTIAGQPLQEQEGNCAQGHLLLVPSAVCQPEFSDDGTALYFVSDAGGEQQHDTGQLYRYDLSSAQITPLSHDGTEYGLPGWVQNMRSYALTAKKHDIDIITNTSTPEVKTVDEIIYAARCNQGVVELMVGKNKNQGSPLNWDKIPELSKFTDITTLIHSYFRRNENRDKNKAGPRALPTTHGERLALVASSATQPPQIIVFERHPTSSCRTGRATVVASVNTPEIKVIKHSSTLNTSELTLSVPEQLSWLSEDGEKVHGLYYSPCARAYDTGVMDSLSGLIIQPPPPLIVLVHGGPTAQVRDSWYPQTQFFTARGYAVLAPNYRGSEGYGKAYRDALYGQWGSLDIADCASAIPYLVSCGKADENRCVIAGGSAGGYTALQMMTQKPTLFAAAMSWYGVADLALLAQDTHKFERYYTNALIEGKHTLKIKPATKDAKQEKTRLYHMRSPLHNVDKIVRPIALFQGADDKVVPKNQTEAIAQRLRNNNIPYIYHLYPGEGHGFRQSRTIQHWYTAMLNFLDRYL